MNAKAFVFDRFKSRDRQQAEEFARYCSELNPDDAKKLAQSLVDVVCFDWSEKLKKGELRELKFYRMRTVPKTGIVWLMLDMKKRNVCGDVPDFLRVAASSCVSLERILQTARVLAPVALKFLNGKGKKVKRKERPSVPPGSIGHAVRIPPQKELVVAAAPGSV